MSSTPPDRIRLSEIVQTIKPLMGKSSFYGSREKPGPRWTDVERLDIRVSRKGVTADRERFERWYRELQGGLGYEPHPTAARLSRARRRPAPTETTYGEQMAALCAALDNGAISREQFDGAIATLPTPS